MLYVVNYKDLNLKLQYHRKLRTVLSENRRSDKEDKRLKNGHFKFSRTPSIAPRHYWCFGQPVPH